MFNVEVAENIARDSANHDWEDFSQFGATYSSLRVLYELLYSSSGLEY